MTFEEQQDFVRNIRGASASILWILLLSGRSLTNKELQRSTGYSDKPVTDALSRLEPRGLVQFVGQHDGWTLGSGLLRLPFSPLQLVEVTRFLLADPEARSIAHNILDEDRNISDLPQLMAEIPSPEELPTLRKEGEDRNISDLHDPHNKNVVVVTKELITTTTTRSHTHEAFVADVLAWMGFEGLPETAVSTQEALAAAFWVKLQTAEFERRHPGQPQRNWCGMVRNRWRKGLHSTPDLLALAQTWLTLDDAAKWQLLDAARRPAMYLPESLLHLEFSTKTFQQLYQATGGQVAPPTLMPTAPPTPTTQPEMADITHPQPSTPPEVQSCWKTTLAELELQMTKATFNTWVKDSNLGAEGETAVVWVRNDYAADWIQNRLAETVLRTLNAIAPTFGLQPFTRLEAHASCL